MSLSDELPSNFKLDRITLYAAIATLLLLFSTNYAFDLIASSQFMKSFSEAVKGLLFAVALPVFNGLRSAFLRSAGAGSLPRQVVRRNDVAAGIVAALCITLIFSLVGFLGGLALGASCGMLSASIAPAACTQAVFGAIATFMVFPITLLFSLWFGWIAHDNLVDRWWKFLAWSLAFLIVAKSIDYYFTLRFDFHTELGVTNDIWFVLGQFVIFPLANVLFLAIGFGLKAAYTSARGFFGAGADRAAPA